MTKPLPPGWHPCTPPDGRPGAVLVRGKVHALSPDEAWSIWKAEHEGHDRPEPGSDPATIAELRAQLAVQRAVNEAAAAMLRGEPFDPRLRSPLMDAAAALRSKLEGERQRMARTLEAMLVRVRKAEGRA